MNEDHDNIEIRITDEDLQNVSPEQEKRIRDFFANPTPVQIPATAVVECKCISTKRPFYLVFEEERAGKWVLTAILDDSWVPATASGDNRMRLSQQMVKGEIDWWGRLGNVNLCPHCRNNSVVQCYCSCLTCVQGGQGSPFLCGWCGQTGKINGYIQHMNAAFGKNKKGT